MRPLTKSEQLLGTLLGLSIFIVGNLFVVTKLAAWGRALDTQRGALNEQKLVADAWLGKSALWEARDQWLKATPATYTTEITPATLVRQLQDLSKARNVRILDQNLLDGTAVPGYRAFAIRLRMAGELEGMVAWLHALQTPSSFVSCSAFSCRLGADTNEMEWEITLTRYYRDPKS